MTTEIAAMQKMVKDMTTTFMAAIEKQTNTIKEIMERKIDVLEHDLFEVKERLDRVEKVNKDLQEKLKTSEEDKEDLRARLAENRSLIIEAKQEKLKYDLVAISPTGSNPLDVPLKNLTGPTIHRTNAKGQHIFQYSFKDIRDKIDHLKRRKELKEQHINLFSPLCPELKNLLQRANGLREKGTFTKVWVHRDRLYIAQSEGDRFPIRNEYDLDFYDH